MNEVEKEERDTSCAVAEGDSHGKSNSVAIMEGRFRVCAHSHSAKSRNGNVREKMRAIEDKDGNLK